MPLEQIPSFMSNTETLKQERLFNLKFFHLVISPYDLTLTNFTNITILNVLF